MARMEKFVLERGMKSPLAHVEEAIHATTVDDVRRAIKNGNCGLAFQPVVHAQTPEKPAFYEGLIRIFESSKRVIPARDFISRVEQTETGRQIDCEALKITLRTLERVPGLQLSVNASARSIGYAPWTDKLSQALRRKPDLVKRMTIEISEKSVMQLPEITARFVNDMSAKGLRFLLDDFGAEHSSFQDLRDIGFSMLKIDGRFIQGIVQKVTALKKTAGPALHSKPQLVRLQKRRIWWSPQTAFIPPYVPRCIQINRRSIGVGC